MYNEQNHTEVEGFILKWTLITTYTGVAILFILKILSLLGLYITSGKIVADFGIYIWKALKAVIFGG